MSTRNARLIALILVAVVTAALAGSTGWAAPVPSQSSCSSTQTVDSSALAAERSLVKGKLMEYGLTEQQATSRVDLLTDQEVHSLATNLDKVQVAGATTLTTTEILLLLILVVLIV